MEKELKISELAQIWGASVPTVWNRIKKLGLKTLIKKNESNKEVNYVCITDEQINEFIIKVDNNVNNVDNNGYYKDMLSVNNVDNNVNNAESVNISGSFVSDLINLNNSYNEQLKTVYNDYNNRLERLTDELITYKSKVPLLEDKANREGFYIKENNDLKDVINQKETLIKKLITVIITLLIIIITFTTWFITVNNINNNNTPISDYIETELNS